MAQLDCVLGESTTLLVPALRNASFGQSLEIDPSLLGDDSVMTYHVLPPHRDAALVDESSKLDLPLQQQDRAREIFGASSTATLHGCESKTLSIPPHAIGRALVPAMESLLSRSCNTGAPATTTQPGEVTKQGGVPSKARFRWTQDLHELFVNCVNKLGGADKATPKGILKLMKPVDITIYQIKSHLQKYRTTKYMPASFEEVSFCCPIAAKKEKSPAGTDLQNLAPNIGTQIVMEVLRLQLDVQRLLDEQIEMQQSLQLRIEEQGNQLQKALEQQQLMASSSQERVAGSMGGAAVRRRRIHIARRATETEDVFDDVQPMSMAGTGSG